jgi:PAS domain S-box-containing protein
MGKNQAEIDNILQMVPGCIYWKDINGVYLGCNQAEAELLGLSSPEEMIGKTDYDLPWKETAASVLRETDKRIMKSKVCEDIIENGTCGNRKLVMLTRKSPLCDDKGEVIGIIGVTVDITERRVKEERESELKTQWTVNNILQYAPGCIYWKDINGVYLGCNQAEAEMLGFKSFKEVTGKTDYDLSWRYVSEILRKTDQRIIDNRETEEVLEIGKVANGKEAVMLTRKSPLYDDKNNVIGIIGVSIDITDRKEKEELEAKLKLEKELSKIAKEVAHDIHSPLAALGAFQYIVQSKLTDKENGILDSLKRSIHDIASRMMEKYKEIKEGESRKGFARVRTVQKKEERINVNLSLKEVLVRKEQEYTNKNVEIKYEEKIVFIKGERVAFERMMSNLINNGVEAVEGKKAEIEVVCEEKGEEVEIIVKDNGQGMPKEMAEKLMREEEVGTTKEYGNGIGTQQVMSTIKSMNGKLKIESREGIGTEFILTFPKADNPM